jgi:hypothetical protein
MGQTAAGIDVSANPFLDIQYRSQAGVHLLRQLALIKANVSPRLADDLSELNDQVFFFHVYTPP